MAQVRQTIVTVTSGSWQNLLVVESDHSAIVTHIIANNEQSTGSTDAQIRINDTSDTVLLADAVTVAAGAIVDLMPSAFDGRGIPLDNTDELEIMSDSDDLTVTIGYIKRDQTSS